MPLTTLRSRPSWVSVLLTLAFLAFPVVVILAQRTWELQVPGLAIAFGTIVAAYYAGPLVGAVVLVESLLLLAKFGEPYTIEFRWESLAWSLAVGLVFVFWIDRVVRRERVALQRSRRAEERYQRIFEGTQVGVISIDPRTRLIESVNPTFCEISGYTVEETVGRDPSFLMHEQSSPVLRTPELPKLLSGELTRLDRSTIMERPDGEKVFVDISAVIVTGEDNEPRLAGTVIDRTAHVLAEEQARRSQKLDAVGRLAGGIAHDFNNLLTVISGYAELAVEKGLPAKAAGDVDAIRQAAGRATRLTRQLLAFSRNVVLNPRAVDLNEVILELGVLLRRLIEAPIKVELNLAPDLPRVHADATQVEQVLMNLVLNARDAMPSGGTLTIETSTVTFGDGDRRLEIERGDYVSIAVSDNGVGMSEDMVEHIFEPFFTTKGEHGTGLGLPTVYGIVHQSGGGVDVRSRLGEGTTMTVYLPVAPASAPDTATSSGAPATGPARSSRILLVEDERAVRDLVETMLSRAGHDVVAADHPDRALELVDGGLDVDLLLTDIVMPARSGIELAEEVARRAPGIAVVFMSGYSEDVHGALPGDDAIFVAKPFHAATLLEQVDAALARRAQATNGPPGALDAS